MGFSMEREMVDDYLQWIYYDAGHARAFAGQIKMLKAAREDGRGDMSLSKIKP